MSSIIRSCCNSINDAYERVSKALTDKPAGYAKENFIKIQRITGLALIAMSLAGAAFNPPVGGVMGLPLFAAGSILIGASLIQQVIGEAKGCGEGRGKRILAGVCIMFATPITWIAGAILWDLSNEDNKRPVRSIF